MIKLKPSFHMIATIAVIAAIAAKKKTSAIAAIIAIIWNRHNVFRCWAVSSFFSSLWLILFSGRIYSENVNWCWSLFTVQKVFLVITDWKQTHRRTFQVFQYYTKLQLKSKLPVGKNVKALSAFLNVQAVRKIQESWLKGSFRKAEKVTVSIMFG